MPPPETPSRLNRLWAVVGAACMGGAVAATATWYLGIYLPRKVGGNHPLAPVSASSPSQQIAPAKDLALKESVEGISAGSVLGISEVSAADNPESTAAETNLKLRIGIQKRANAVVDRNQMKIQVLFYDTVDDKDIKLTNAELDYEWVTPPHDWQLANPEILAVTYLRPKNKAVSPDAALSGAAASVNPNKKGQRNKSSDTGGSEGERRQYLGYIVRVYYNDKLQAVRADPAKLDDLFPSPGSSPSSDPSALPPIEGSPTERSLKFAKYAATLLEHEKAKIEPLVFMPTAARSITARFPWKTNIVTTVFWIGEKSSGKKTGRTSKSAWDSNWQKNYGGIDDPNPSARRNYIPVGFVPGQNPFYCALPYNDVAHGQFKPEAPLVIPWFRQAYTGPGFSVCQHRWVAIRKGGRTCYAQWEDCGPFFADNFQYVFQSERPRTNQNHGAGLSVSPAVRDYLGLAPTDLTDWQFADVRDVLPGPWRNYGENNHFVIARRAIEQKAVP